MRTTLILGTSIFLLTTASAFAAEQPVAQSQPIQLSEAQIQRPLPATGLRITQREPILVATPAPVQQQQTDDTERLMRFSFGI